MTTTDPMTATDRERLTRRSRSVAIQAAQMVAAWRARGASDFDILLAQTKAAYERFDSLVAALEPRPVACARGCVGCCYLSVGASFGEALTVARHLRDERPDLIPPAQAAAKKVRSFRTSHDRFAAALPCAFLEEDGACAVYPVRPMGCRNAHSPDARLCGPLNDPRGENEIPQHGPTREAAEDIMLALTVLNNLVTGRPVSGEFVNGRGLRAGGPGGNHADALR